MTKQTHSRTQLRSIATVMLPASFMIMLINVLIIGAIALFQINMDSSRIEVPTRVAGLSSKPMSMAATMVREPVAPAVVKEVDGIALS